jgi:hypothetical protein
MIIHDYLFNYLIENLIERNEIHPRQNLHYAIALIFKLTAGNISHIVHNKNISILHL